MKHSQFRAAAVPVVAVAFAACASAAPRAAQTAPSSVSQAASQSAPPTSGDIAAMAKASRDSARYPYTDADIHFMSGMIGHHAQAIVMARWAPTHGASAVGPQLCERIINAQKDEIASCRRGCATGTSRCPRRTRRHEDDDERHAAHDADARHAHRGADEAARRGARRRVRPAVPHLHDPAPPGAVSMVKELFAHLRRRPGRDRLQVRVRRQRRSDHRDRPHGADARAVVTLGPRAVITRSVPSLPPRSSEESDMTSPSLPRWSSSLARRRARWSRIAACMSPARRRRRRARRRRRRRAIRAVDVHDRRAEPRSARRPQGRAVGRRRRRPGTSSSSRPQAVARSSSAAPTPTSRSPATTSSRATTTASRSGTSRTRRAPALKVGVLLPGVAERRVGLQEPAVRVGRSEHRRASTAARRA